LLALSRAEQDFFLLDDALAGRVLLALSRAEQDFFLLDVMAWLGSHLRTALCKLRFEILFAPPAVSTRLTFFSAEELQGRRGLLAHMISRRVVGISKSKK